MRIKKTKDYEIFKFSKYTSSRIDEIEANRILNLAVDIEECNLLHINPITVDADMTIIDGQTRVKAAETLGVDIYYIQVTDNIDPMHIARMNDRTKKWTPRNYCEFYIAYGIEDYRILKWFHNEYGISYADSVMLLAGRLDRNELKNTKAVRESFKNGTFKVVNLKRAKQVAEYIKDFGEYVDWNTNRYFVSAVRIISDKEGYDHAVMMRQVENNPRKLQKCVNTRDYVLMLSELYNYHLKNTNRLQVAYTQ